MCKFIPLGKTKTLFISTILVIICEIIFQGQIIADVKKAIQNLQEGLDEAILTIIPEERKFVRFDKREDGILIYKVSIQKVDEKTVRIRVTGYSGMDVISIITYRIIDGEGYKTIEEYKHQKQATDIGITKTKKGVKQ